MEIPRFSKTEAAVRGGRVVARINKIRYVSWSATFTAQVGEFIVARYSI